MIEYFILAVFCAFAAIAANSINSYVYNHEYDPICEVITTILEIVGGMAFFWSIMCLS